MSRWQEVDKLLEAALEREPSQRPAFLDEACAGDEELRREVESLLAAHEGAGSFIEAPALEVAARATGTERARLVAGQQLGSYKILSPLGAGGMGEVYKARDTRIGREVAIKVLPSAFSSDVHSLSRFELEARAAGRLNHPNILAIYDVGTHEESPYIISELLEGETLRDRLGGKSLPLRKAIDYGLQLARGLAAAHEKGIIHRDLRPENLFITKDGLVKILDFGLAKLRPKRGKVTETAVPTQAVNTKPGLVLGTVGYMSPEQVRGEPADHRSDIFALGAILHEMLSGERAFRGESAVETMRATLREEPLELSKASSRIPQTLKHIVRHCLEKVPEQRFQSARDLAFDLDEVIHSMGSTAELHATLFERLKRRESLAWILLVVCFVSLLAVLIASYYSRHTNVNLRTVRFTVNPPEKGTFGGSLALSPDGRWLAFVALTVDGKRSLWLRALDSLTAQALPGTEGGIYPFWSPDGRFIGFFAQGKLKKIEISGGPPQALCDAPFPLGGTWNREGVIVFAPNYKDPLYRISAGGGEATPVTTVDRSRNETHLWPHFLPDGHDFLYLSWNSPNVPRDVVNVASLDSKESKRYFLMAGNSNVAYVPQGYLFFVRDGTLFRQAFDPKGLQLTGEPIPLAERIAETGGHSYIDFSVSEGGLAYRSDNPSKSQPIWFDRNGKSLGPLGQPGLYRDPWLFPDEKQVALSLGDTYANASDIWLIDLPSGNPVRLTFHPSDDLFSVCSPDGSGIVFAGNRTGYYELYQKSSSGAGDDELLLQTRTSKEPSDWSLDGRFIVYLDILPKTQWDLWVLPMFGDRQPRPFLQSEFNEKQGRFSPDGRWMAYASDESGKYEVYVQPFPAAGGKRQISSDGGEQPSWRRDGRELFYIADEKKLMAVEVETNSPGFRASVPKELFRIHVFSDLYTRNQYAVTADGQRFLVNTLVEESAPSLITVVVNWAAGLKR